MTIYADLHNHTTASDGDFTPDELIYQAKELGIKAIGVTDHDTLQGLGNALSAGDNYGIEVIPGVEVSIKFKRSFFTGTLHLLCYFPAGLLSNKDFRASFSEILSRGRGDKLVSQRVEEINRIFGPLGETPVLSEELLFESISQYSTNATRRHFGLALNEVHNISDKKQVDKIIGNKSPAYVPSGVSLEDIKSILKEYDIVTVLAHPAAGSFKGRGHYKEVLPTFETVEKLLPEFLEAGLKGLEVYYPGHGEEYIEPLLSLAEEHNLLVTGGSDCHDMKKRPLGKQGLGKADFDLFKAMLDKTRLTSFSPEAL